MKPKLLLPRDKFRQMGVVRLREYLQHLQDESDAGRGGQELYDTFVYATNELERRKARRQERPPMLVKPSEVYLLRADAMRTMIRRLESKASMTEEEHNTLAALRREEQRRKDHAKYTYAKRKAEVRAREADLCSTL